MNRNTSKKPNTAPSVKNTRTAYSNARKGATRPSAGRATSPKKQTRRPNRNNGFIKPNDVIRVRSGIDIVMLVIIILLVCFGLIMVFSSSFATALQKKGDSYYYIKRQLVFAVIGFAGMLGISLFDYRFMRRLTTPAFIFMIVLLALVPVYGLSRGQATRWINIGGFQLQPSEPMKTVLVMLLAHYFATYQKKITNYRDLKEASIWGDLIPYMIVGFVCLLVAIEKHFSGVIILFLIGTIVIFAGGAVKRWLFIAAGAGGTVVLIAIMFTDYAKKRIDIWLHPENYDTMGEVWQTLQGLNAIGSGGLLGVGLGNSYQKYSYVSEAQNDFIFSIVCEELGFVGALAVIALFVLFVWRGFVIATKAPDTFSSLVAIGIVGKVGVQAILNISVVTAMIPNTGVTLPFFSYGGSALLQLLFEMGILLAISRYSYQDKQ